MPRRYAPCGSAAILYPDRAPHTLDAIIARFNLDGEPRHRALGDARVLWRLLQRLSDRHSPSEIEFAVHALLRRPALPPNLPPDAIDALPHAPGVYLFYGLNEHPIYIGKSVDLRARVASHFNSEYRAPRELRLSQEIHRLEWEETAGEFGALLRESELIKTQIAGAQRCVATQARTRCCSASMTKGAPR